MEPRTIDHFDLIDRLGAGGMGVVYRARDRILGREVALKLVRPERAGDTQARQRFLREARAAALLGHPAIATVYEAGEAAVEGDAAAEPALFIAEELVRGEPLTERLRLGARPFEEVLSLGLQLAEALADAHEHGIVHRDVKPSNLMVTPDGRLKVLDFGLARRWESPDLDTAEADAETVSRTAPGLIVGTPAYMAPEQIGGETIGPAADVYGAGCVLYELLTGRPPHVGRNTAELLRRSLTETPRPISSLRPETPLALAGVVMRALSRDAADRFPDGAALAAALRGVSPAAAPLRPRRRVSGRAALAAAAAGLLGVAAWAWWQRARPALAFNERDFVLVTDVVNSTGEAVFDLALKSAIETDLRQSRYVNVFEPSRVQDALRLMRLPPDTPIDERVGRELCRRAGGRGLVVPSILRAGEAYQVGASLLDPSTGRVVKEAHVVARGREQVLLSSIDALTRGLRERLGESIESIARADPPFTRYTTSSLEALELLSVGARAWARGEFDKAERAFREALERDPRFAAARGSLGLLLIQFLGRADEGKAELARALHDSGEVSKREHLHLRALNKQFVAEDLPGALEDYRFISELYPDMMQPYNNSGRILEALGRPREAVAMYDRAHEKDPTALVPLWNAFFLRAGRLQDPTGSERVARALVAQAPDSANAAHCLAWSLVMQRRFDEAEKAMRATLKLEPEHAYALPNLGHLLLRRGAATEAVPVYRGLVAARARQEEKPSDSLCLGLALRAAGQESESRTTLLAAAEEMRARRGALTPLQEATLATLLASAGRSEEARARLARAEAPGEPGGETAAWVARAYAALGELDRAASLYEHAVSTGWNDPYDVLVDPGLAAIRDRPEIDRLVPARGPAS